MRQVPERLDAQSLVPAWSVIGAAGVLLLGASLWNFARELRTLGFEYGPVVAAAAGVALSGGVLFVSYDVRAGDFDGVERWTVAANALGAGLFTALAFALTVGIRAVEGRSTPDPLFPLVVMASLGVLGGVAIGRNRVETRRTAASARESRDAMAFTNSLLRHDVRNGLQVIAGRAELLADHDDERVRESAEAIRGQTESLDRLVAEVRSVTEVLTGDLERETVDLAVIVRDVVETAADGHPDVVVERDLPEALPVAGAEALYSVFRNVVDNAVTHVDADPVRVRVTGERDGDRVRVRVADNGQGIPEAERDRVFERGVSDGGSGHGLYVARVIVDRLGGDIRVEDGDLGGAVFEVALPAGRQRQTEGAEGRSGDR